MRTEKNNTREKFTSLDFSVCGKLGRICREKKKRETIVCVTYIPFFLSGTDICRRRENVFTKYFNYLIVKSSAPRSPTAVGRTRASNC